MSEKYKFKGYRIDGVAACRLAWHWFSCQPYWTTPETLASRQHFIDRIVSEPYAVRLAGEYDIWDKRDPNADTFQFGLRSEELTDTDWRLLLDGHGMNSASQVHRLLVGGRILQRYENEGAARAIKEYGFIVEFEGLKFLAMNTPRKGSLAFDARDVPETGHDALLKFNWTGKFWDVSMYHSKHRKDLDLSSIASKYGGGGHRGACGFRVDKLPFLPL